ncbi:hypothetical protein EJ05DRAFT_273390 [Pseudovirgaria hyperparasitica]|uniref:Uncharacterized protein n=1 Tax=Pseudovirgaria hyperparasitica TaxID=470096 RepID=A0A6A6WE46_9PEZI|nr:uncharacterized protein EJ05DRAFT_273390 [Pseudovirgaria hyperparasitica]KAF2760136.1 hypothetical protein EJ05DRAFT_273390 [Pseudovirgaria hyperparasitica]
MTVEKPPTLERFGRNATPISIYGTVSSSDTPRSDRVVEDGDRRQVRRRDSVATSSSSSDRKHRRADSRRSSTQSGKRPGLARAHTSHGAIPRRMTTQEAVDFHRQSVSLFQSLPQGPYSAPSSPKRENVIPFTTVLNFGTNMPYSRSPPITTTRLEYPDQEEEEEEELYEPVPPTIIHWTSPDTRRQQYAEIDRMHSGLRGLWRKVAPRWLCPRVPAKFYDEKNGDDSCSVRRHRLSLPQHSEAGSLKSSSARPTVARNLSCF